MVVRASTLESNDEPSKSIQCHSSELLSHILTGLFSAFGLILILTLGLTIYGLASFQGTEGGENLESAKGWRNFTSGFSIGAFGGASVAYVLLDNISFFA